MNVTQEVYGYLENNPQQTWSQKIAQRLRTRVGGRNNALWEQGAGCLKGDYISGVEVSASPDYPTESQSSLNPRVMRPYLYRVQHPHNPGFAVGSRAAA